MPRIPPVTTAGLDDLNRQRRHREVTDLMLNFQHDDSRIRSTTEISDGVTPINFAFPPGDVRRYVNGATENPAGWYCYGQQATFASNTAFTIGGDYTTRYPFAYRVKLLSSTGTAVYGRIRKSTYSAGVTRVVIQADSGNVPATISAVSVELVAHIGQPTNLVWNIPATSGPEPFFWNTANSADDVSGIQIALGVATGFTDTSGESFDGADTALAIRVTHSTRTTSLLNGGSGFVTGASVVYHTGEDTPLVFGVNDQERLIISAGTSAILFCRAEEAARFVSPRADDLGGIYISFYENDNTTRKGYFGYSNPGTNNNLMLVQEESAPIVLSGGNKHAFTNANKAFVFDVLDAYADDAAAAAGGVEVGELYRTGSAIKQRVS